MASFTAIHITSADADSDAIDAATVTLTAALNREAESRGATVVSTTRTITNMKSVRNPGDDFDHLEPAVVGDDIAAIEITLIGSDS